MKDKKEKPPIWPITTTAPTDMNGKVQKRGMDFYDKKRDKNHYQGKYGKWEDE